LSLLASGARAAPIPFVNGHYYEYVAAPNTSWTSADAAASSLSDLGLPGHLATITSAEENSFVTDLLPLLPGADIYTLQAAYLGGVQFDTSGALDQGWGWVTGEPWSYTNWAPLEPNGADESYLCIWMADTHPLRVRGTWNDGTNSGILMAGYVVEYDAVPEPGGLGLCALALGALAFSARQRENVG
jgi:hypothetical protein